MHSKTAGSAMAVRMTTTIWWARSVSGRIKKAGATPRNKPNVVKPKANPGCFGKTDTKIATVTGMVMLNSAMPIRDSAILELPPSKKGSPTSKLK